MEEGKQYRWKTNDRRSGEALFRCAAIFLPYLNPAELFCVSSTCKTLYQISKNVTSRRTSDVSRGFEKFPVPFHNPISGDPQPYSYFLYTPTQTLRAPPDFRQPWGSDHEARSDPSDPFLFRVDGARGCESCSNGCGGDNCPCSNLECGPSCTCDSGCVNRVTQCGVNVRLKIAKDEKKGWGLYAAEFIPGGRFVCEYAGEVLSSKEAKERQQKYDEMARLTPALLVVKEHLPFGNTCMRMNIDATRIGNIARFINHATAGTSIPSYSEVPELCFPAFASLRPQIFKKTRS